MTHQMGVNAAVRRSPKPKPKAPATASVKYDDSGKLILMASAGGYVMCRRPGSVPSVRSLKEWNALSNTPVVHAAEQAETLPA